MKLTISEKFNLRGWIYDDIIEECNSYDEINKQIIYLKYVLTEWNTNRPRLDPNGTLFPIFENRIKMEIEKREIIKEEQENKKIEWAGTKGEFAAFVNDTYLSNKGKYNSVRDTAFLLFNDYKFKWKDWDKEKCYNYVRKK